MSQPIVDSHSSVNELMLLTRYASIALDISLPNSLLLVSLVRITLQPLGLRSDKILNALSSFVPMTTREGFVKSLIAEPSDRNSGMLTTEKLAL